MKQYAFSKIWIIFALAVFIAGGILAWQYWMPREEVKVPKVVEKPYIKVISPNGGERWVRGNTYRITWESEGIDHVTIRLSYFRGEDEAIAILPNNPGFYDWTIPSNQAIGDKCSVTVVQYTPDAPDILDSSDDYFSIVEKDETTNWKTYRSEKWGFEIKYPEGTKITDIDADTGWFFMQVPFAENKTKLVSKILQIHVAATEFHYGAEIPASCVSDDNIGSLVVNGIKFIKSDVSGDFAGMQGRAVATEYCTMKGDLAFKLTFRLGYNQYSQLPDFDQEKESVILNQMLSTFKFLE